ncbi:MAG: threonine/serine dehydratase [Gemmatimonadota bacterium]|jgi:threonine dehydratase
MDTDPPSPGDVRRARERVARAVHHTPLSGSTTLSREVGAPIHLKCEHLQKTGSFKVRGALNFMLGLDDQARARGVVTISAGNHAQATAWAARRAGVPATVVMPADASRTKAAASAEYGADVVLHGTVFEAFRLALDRAEDEGLTFVHPFDDPRILAGQGTVALEILDDLPDVATLVVPIGGGGLCGGIAAALAERPDIRLFGVEPEGAAAMRRSLDLGRPVRLDAVDTVADGLGAPMAGELTYPLIRDRVEDVVVVRDRAITEAMAFLLERTKQLVEPAGAAGVAALRQGLVPPGPGPVGVVLSGGNVDLDRLGDLLRP